MNSLREEMQSMKKASEAEVDQTSASKAGPSKPSDVRPFGCSTYGKGLLWSFFSTGLAKVYCPKMAPSTQIFIPNTQIPSPNTLYNRQGCVLPEPKNTRRRNKVRAKNFSESSSSVFPNGLLLSKTHNNKIIQTQSFTGR